MRQLIRSNIDPPPLSRPSSLYAKFFTRGEEGSVRTAIHGIDGYYPAFDITPPHLISAIVTDRGIFAPNAVREYFDTRP